MADYWKETPEITALKSTYDGTISATTEITLQTNTSILEVSAITKPIVLSWGTGDASAATDGFDEIIQPGETRHFKVPVDPSTGVRYTAVNFIEQAATAILICIEK
jgi:hypothetical protein